MPRYEQYDRDGKLVSAIDIPDPPIVINKRTVEDRARAALTANAAFRALQSPTNAQVLAQVRRLTAQCSALIRLALNELDTIDDTNGT